MYIHFIAWLDQSVGQIALQVAVAVTLMLLVALLVSWILRRSAASVRHRVWALAILGLLAYPLVQPFLPKVSLGFQTALSENAADAGTAARTVLPLPDRGLAKVITTRPDRSAAPSPALKPITKEEADIRLPAVATPAQATAVHWPVITAAVWAIGLLIGLGFLAKSHLAAAQLVRTATPSSDPSWAETVGTLAAQLGLRRRVAVRISHRIAVPMTAGWFRPVVLLPAGCDGWTASRRRMVLIHELSHVARGDVLWQIAAKLARAIYWPHPSVWVAVRQMQVEREAACDDAVLRDVERPSEYASLLLDVAESFSGRNTAAIAMAGAGSVEERIRWIVQPGRRRLPIGRRTAWMFSVGAILIVLGLGSISIFAGPPASVPAEPASAKEAEGTGTSAQKMLKLPLRVTDTDGKPVADARVVPWALGGAHGHGLWQDDDKRAGVGPKEVITGKDGTATILYPRYNNLQERVRTSIVSLFVDHPKFAFVDGLHIDVPLESKGPYEIKMTPGVPVDVRPLIDGKPAPLDDVYLLWSDGRSWRKGPWPRKTADGTLQIPAMRPGKNRVLAVKLDGGRATHFSNIVEFELTAGEPKTIDAALRPSPRIQGVLSDNVPRPVRRGRIRAYTLPPAGTDDEPTVWETWTAIEPDGTFTIDGWPAGERMQLVALCDGYIAKPGPVPDVVENPPAPEADSFGRPQIFDPGKNGPVTVEMTPLVRCVVTAVDEKDKPLEGVPVVSWPNVGWWNIGSQIYCHPLVRGERLLREREYFDANDEAFPTPFQGTTDAQGKVTLELPAGKEDLAVESDAYEVPMLFGNRYVRVELVPGRTTEATLRLQPRGTEKLGEWDKLHDVIFGGSTRESRRIRALPGVQEKIDEFAKRFLEAKDQRDPRLLSEAYEAVADAFIGAGDIEEVFKRHKKAAEQAAKDKATEQRKAKTE